MKKIKYGLYFENILFVWINKELYKYPYFDSKTKRSYSLKKITTRYFGNTLHYRLNSKWVSEEKIKQLTSLVSVESLNISITDIDLPSWD
jgi:hypothetical protein